MISLWTACVVLSCFAGSAGADPGLVAHWTFDQGSGTVAADSSGNGHDGTIHGATWVTDVAPVQGGSHALSFDGTDDYVSVPDSDSLDLTTQGTIQLWAQISSTHSTAEGTSILAKMTHTSHVSYDFRVNETNTLSTYLWDGTTTCEIVYNTVVTDDTWHHFAMTWDQPTGIRLYVDGDLHEQINLDNAGAIVTSWPIWIGRARYAPDRTFYYLKGKVDEIKLYNYARTSEQIAADNVEAASVPVILVHGYRKDETKTGPEQWGRMEELLEDPEEATEPVFQVTHWDYTSAGKDTSIEVLADLLAQKIILIKAVAGVDEVDVVAYSMGGLITRRYIANGGTGIRKFIQIASPNYGSDVARWQARRFEQAKQMCYASHFLYKLHSDESTDGFLSSVEYLTVVGKYDNVVAQISAACAEFSAEQRVVPYAHSSDPIFQGIADVDGEGHETLKIVRSFCLGSDDWRSIGSGDWDSRWGVWVRVEDSTQQVIKAESKLFLKGPSGSVFAPWKRNRSKDSGMYYINALLTVEPEGYTVEVRRGNQTQDSTGIALESGRVNVLTFQFD